MVPNFVLYKNTNTMNHPTAIQTANYFDARNIINSFPRVSNVPFTLDRIAKRERTFPGIPDMTAVVRELIATFFKSSYPFNARQFVPVLQALVLNKTEIARFLEHPVSKHVLVNNHLLKVILIRWAPGKFSSIHGHPKDGCVFKVLHGKVEETRYKNDENRNLFIINRCQKGTMAYIDDTMALHKVGNPYKEPAISIHAYTPGSLKLNPAFTNN